MLFAVAIERDVAGQCDTYACQHDKRQHLYGTLDDVVLSEIIYTQPTCQQLIDGKGAEHDEYLNGERPDDIAPHA